ncbi:MAG: hypothetical protein ABI867_17485 [Kofleriaceae bacterium]
MRIALVLLPVLALIPRVAQAGELDLNFGLQATHTAWDDDHGGGPTASVSWFFTPAFAVNFTGKEHYATVDERYMTYLSVNGVARTMLGDSLRVSAMLGVVHQHEETQDIVDAMPLESALGVADGIRHRMASRAGAQLAIPFSQLAQGDMYIALDLDTTVFADKDRGPRWMMSAGLSLGVTHDFGQRGTK